MRTLSPLYTPNRLGYRAWAKDHPRSPSKGPIVDAPVFVLGKIANIGQPNIKETSFPGSLDHADIKRPAEIFREEGEDIDFHYFFLRFSLFFVLLATFLALNF